MTQYLNRIISVVGLAFLATGCWAEELVGRIVGVVDGDTIDVLTPNKQQVRVRLAGIDAPEKKQAFGNAAKQELSNLVFNQQVVVDWSKQDRHGRTIGKVLFHGSDINLQMVALGMAWHYKRYMHEQPPGDRERYAAAESAARAQRIGLWRDANPIPPWEFRHPPRRNGR